MIDISKRAKPSYIEKRKEESGNITYIYDKKHIEKRNKGKMARLKKLNKSLSKLRSQVREDLKSNDDELRFTALAVALIDETYERVGNPESAKERKHYGVTTWLKKHITFSKGKVKIKYVGKSGVAQEKEVAEKGTVSALKDLLKDKKDKDKIFQGDDYSITAEQVNKYLKPFKISAKDIRGLHANEEMRKALKKVRKGKLPSKDDAKEREKKLKEEFKEALEIAAKRVGHEPSTLKNQYLIPTMEPDYMKDGRIGTLAFSEYAIVKTADLDIDELDGAPKIGISPRFIENGRFNQGAFRSNGATHPYEWLHEDGTPSAEIFLSKRELLSSVDYVFKSKDVEINSKIDQGLAPLYNNILRDDEKYAAQTFVDRNTYLSKRAQMPEILKEHWGDSEQNEQTYDQVPETIKEHWGDPREQKDYGFGEKHSEPYLNDLQAYVFEGEYSPRKFNVKNYSTIAGHPNKPQEDGVLWTSTLKDQQTEWNKFCNVEQFGSPEKAALFSVDPGAKIYRISSQEDYDALYEKYPLQATDPMEKMIYEGKGTGNIDFEAVAQDYDAIHFTGERIFEMRSWDVESTIWFNGNHLKLERIVDIKNKCILARQEFSLSKRAAAHETPCQTPGAEYSTEVDPKEIRLSVRLPQDLQPAPQSPDVVIEPMDGVVQQAVNRIKSMEPALLHNITKIVVHQGGGSGQLGHVEMGPNKDPREVHIFKDRLTHHVRNNMTGSPEADIQKSVIEAIMETIAHEAGHIGKTRTQEQILTQPFFGEPEAERQQEEFRRKLSIRDFVLSKRGENITEFFERAEREKEPQDQKERVVYLVKNNPYKFFQEELDKTNPELGREAATNWLRDKTLDMVAFFNLKLHEKYPELEKQAAMKLAEQSPIGFFNLKLDKKYPELGHQAAAVIFRKDPSRALNWNLHKKYPQEATQTAAQFAKNKPVAYLKFGLDKTHPKFLQEPTVQKLINRSADNMIKVLDELLSTGRSQLPEEPMMGAFKNEKAQEKLKELKSLPEEYIVIENEDDESLTLKKRELPRHGEVGNWLHVVNVDIDNLEKFLNDLKNLDAELAASEPEDLLFHTKTRFLGVIFHGPAVAVFDQDVYSDPDPYTGRRIIDPEERGTARTEAWINPSKLKLVGIATDVPEFAKIAEKMGLTVVNTSPEALVMPAIKEKGDEGLDIERYKRRKKVVDEEDDRHAERARQMGYYEYADDADWPASLNIWAVKSKQDLIDTIQRMSARSMYHFSGHCKKRLEREEAGSRLERDILHSLKNAVGVRPGRDNAIVVLGPDTEGTLIENVLVVQRYEDKMELKLITCNMRAKPYKYELEETFDLSKRSHLISKRAQKDQSPAKRTAESLFKIIEFAFYRVPPAERKRFFSRLRGKIIKLNPMDITSKEQPPASAVGQSITFAKHLLAGLRPAFVQQVLAELVAVISREMGSAADDTNHAKTKIKKLKEKIQNSSDPWALEATPSDKPFAALLPEYEAWHSEIGSNPYGILSIPVGQPGGGR